MNRFIKVALYICIPLLLTGCITDQVIIDGEMALYLQERVNEELIDVDSSVRGNAPSNLVNGGYLLEREGCLYFINQMEFDDGSTYGYLQRLHTSQRGSLIYDNDLLLDFNGQLLGFWESNIIGLEENQLLLIDLEEYYKEPISEALVTRAHIFGEALFYSNLEGDLYCLSGAGEELLIKGVGELLSLDNHYFYTLFNGNLELIDRAEMKVVKSLTGGSYETATFGREGLLFLEEESLKRQSYTSGEIKEVLSGIRSYGREGYCLVTASTEGGLCISCLDGTAKRRISDDLADSLLLIDGRLYYFNLYDNKAIYTIKIEDEVRSALFSETLTDGGLQFIRYGSGEEQSLLEAYLPFLQEVVGKQSQYGEQQLPYDGKVIFITQTGEFYHRKGEEITLNDLFYLALITYHSTHLGTYSDGGQAFRTDTVITLFVPFDPNPLISITVRGYDPIQIKTGEGDRYGMLASWHPAALRLLESDMFKQVLSH
jgi:hypothetical protein